MYVIVSIYMIHVTIRVAHDLRKSNHPLKCATTELSSSDKSMVLLDLLIFGNQENVFCVQLIVGMLHTFHFAGLCPSLLSSAWACCTPKQKGERIIR